MPGELNYRNRRILYAVLTEYIATGEPVGSRRVAKRYGINLSPATIRNVLADLEEAGYVTQPHTSAGRVPTDLGFRVFVDALVQMRDVTEEDRAAVLARLSNLSPADDIMRETGRLLSTLTGVAAVLAPPKAAEERLSQLRFMPLREGELLVVMVTSSGAVQNRALRFGGTLEVGELERVNNYLADLVEGRRLIDIRNEVERRMESERDRYQALRRRADEMLAAVPEEADRQIVIEGQGVLFDRPEFGDAEKIRGYLRTFEERELLVSLLDQTLTSGGVQVLIGSETNIESVKDITVIASSYGGSGSAQGGVAVIGPTRMDYAKVVPLVDFTARVMSEVLDARRVEDDPS